MQCLYIQHSLHVNSTSVNGRQDMLVTHIQMALCMHALMVAHLVFKIHANIFHSTVTVLYCKGFGLAHELAGRGSATSRPAAALFTDFVIVDQYCNLLSRHSDVTVTEIASDCHYLLCNLMTAYGTVIAVSLVIVG